MAKSWGWKTQLSAAVDPAASVTYDAPGYDPDLVDQATLEVAVAGRKLMVPGEAGVSFDEETVTVVNNTSAAWPVGAEVYVYAAAKAIDPDNLQALESAVTQNTADIDGLKTGVTQNTADIASLEARVTALENVAGRRR